MPLTEKQEEDYLNAGGEFCPKCESRKTTRCQGKPVEGERTLAYRRCEDCGYRWKDIYALSAIDDVEPGEVPDAMLLMPVPVLKDGEPIEGRQDVLQLYDDLGLRVFLGGDRDSLAPDVVIERDERFWRVFVHPNRNEAVCIVELAPDGSMATITDERDQVLAEYRESRATIAKKLAMLAKGEDALDEMVHQAVSATASAINNAGLESQIEYLLEQGVSAKEILDRLTAEEEFNMPCSACGRTDLPLHTDYMCPNCSPKGKS